MAHPHQLGKYQITGVLGEGAMGVVYRGFDPDIRRVVALKTIRHEPGSSAQALQHSAARFRNEAQAAGRLLHPGIVGVYDFGDSPDGAGGRVAYIAMEFVEGHTLASYMAQRVRFGLADIASIGAQLADALGHAHEHGVWHRDIKPSNVIMTRSGRVKIADFGIARTDNANLTLANSVVGTPMYMAPEQFMGKAFDHRVDVYGVGVLLYQLIAGRPPFVGSNEQLMFKVVHETPPPPSSVEGAPASMAHPALDAVVERALAKDPAQRFASAAALRDALAQALGGAVPVAVAHEVVHAPAGASGYATTVCTTPRVAPGAAASAGTLAAPTNWDPAVLARVEAALARHVGPLAGVLVRRVARECHDIPELYTRLGEQITQASVREAFLARVSSSGAAGTGSRTAGTGNGTGSGTQRPATAANAVPPGPPVSDALLVQAQRVLAQQLGPIAKVVVRRAAERTRQRDALFAALLETVPEAVRARVHAELAKLV